MVVICLSRGGAKKRPFFNVVVADSAGPPCHGKPRAKTLW
jgi:ribosomal protein S16